MEAEAAMALPNDLLADVLGRLPARGLAASRRVCKAWRDLVDERRLLLRLRRLQAYSWYKVMDHCNGLVLYWDSGVHQIPWVSSVQGGYLLVPGSVRSRGF